MTKSWIFKIFRKSGYDRCSNDVKTCKNWRNFKIQKKIEKLILELPFGIGFIRIHQPARFVQHFEIWWFSGFSTPFSKMCQKGLPLISGSVTYQFKKSGLLVANYKISSSFPFFFTAKKLITFKIFPFCKKLKNHF